MKEQTDWVVTELAVTGYSHLFKGVERQDAHASLKGDGWAIMAVADGHGSEKSPLSVIGAELAVQSFTEVAYAMLQSVWKSDTPDSPHTLRATFDGLRPSVLGRWKEKVTRRYQQMAAAMHLPATDQVPLKWFGTTLLGALLLEEKAVIYFQLGDGNILRLVEGALQAVFPPKSERGLIGTETFSLSSERAADHAQVHVEFRCPEAVVLATDGIDDSCPSEEVFEQIFRYFIGQAEKEPPGPARQWAELLQRFNTPAPQLADLLRSVTDSQTAYLYHTMRTALAQISRDGSGDDITLLMATRRPLRALHPEAATTSEQARPSAEPLTAPPAEAATEEEGVHALQVATEQAAPMQVAPVQMEEIPVPTASSEEASVQEAASAEESPLQVAPVQAAPMQAAPVQVAPVQVAPPEEDPFRKMVAPSEQPRNPSEGG